MNNPVNVLLVEDNEDHAELVKRQLRRHRITNQVFHVPDGQVALDYLQRVGQFIDPVTSPRPDIILLDLRLPKVDGLQVLQALKASDDLRSIPVVILTTSDSEQDVVRAYENHVNSYVVKPVNSDLFNTMMKDLGFYWLAWNTHP